MGKASAASRRMLAGEDVAALAEAHRQLGHEIAIAPDDADALAAAYALLSNVVTKYRMAS